MNTVMKMNRSGIGYLANQEKKAQAQHHQQHKSKPKPKRCFECGQGHFAHECQTPPPQPLSKNARPFAFNDHYILRKDKMLKKLNKNGDKNHHVPFPLFTLSIYI